MPSFAQANIILQYITPEGMRDRKAFMGLPNARKWARERVTADPRKHTSAEGLPTALHPTLEEGIVIEKGSTFDELFPPAPLVQLPPTVIATSEQRTTAIQNLLGLDKPSTVRGLALLAFPATANPYPFADLPAQDLTPLAESFVQPEN